MEDLADELESCTIIRFPEHVAAEIQAQLAIEDDEWKKQFQSDIRTPIASSLESRLSIKWNQDKRHCVVKWDDTILKGRLCDLPTIVEAYKTTDKKTFYKSSTISQMLVCCENEKDINPRNEVPGIKDERRFQLLAGLAPPLKNVKKRRFRKVIRKRHCEAPEVEKELKRLLREDLEALSVDYELISDPDYKKSGKGNKPKDDSHQDIHDIFDEVSSDSDDDENEEKIDLAQHLSWDISGQYEDKLRRLQDQACKLVEAIDNLKNRRAKKEKELESSIKEEKKEKLRSEIEEIRRKENDKEKGYLEHIKKAARY